MRILIKLLFFVLISVSATSQALRPSGFPTTNSPARFDITGYQQDSAFLYILRDSFPAKFPSVIYHPNGNLYKSPGGIGAHWSLITDTSFLSARINLKLNISDTANMLANYLKKSDTSNMLSGYKTYYPRTAISGGTGITYDPATGIIVNNSPSSGGTVTTANSPLFLSSGGTTVNADTGRGNAQLTTGYDLNKVADSLKHVQNSGFSYNWLSRTYDAYVTVTNGSITKTINAISDATATKRYRVYVPNGTYSSEAIVPKSYVDIIGESVDGVIVQSSRTDSATIQFLATETMVANMTVNHTLSIGDPHSYPIHADYPGGANTMVLYNIKANTLGSYTPGINAFGAIGIGLWSGQKMYLVDVVATSATMTAILAHNIAAQQFAVELYMINTSGTSVPYDGFSWKNLGSGRNDLIKIIGGVYSGASHDIFVGNIGSGAGEVLIAVDSLNTSGGVTIASGAGTRLRGNANVYAPQNYLVESKNQLFGWDGIFNIGSSDNNRPKDIFSTGNSILGGNLSATGNIIGNSVTIANSSTPFTIANQFAITPILTPIAGITVGTQLKALGSNDLNLFGSGDLGSAGNGINLYAYNQSLFKRAFSILNTAGTPTKVKIQQDGGDISTGSSSLDSLNVSGILYVPNIAATASSVNVLVSDGGSVKTQTAAQVVSNGGAVLTTRTINTTAPLTGGGALSSNLTLAISNAASDGVTKGAATFNSTNFTAPAGVVNTIQNINLTATPSFAAAILTGNATMITFSNTGLVRTRTTTASGLTVGLEFNSNSNNDLNFVPSGNAGTAGRGVNIYSYDGSLFKRSVSTENTSGTAPTTLYLQRDGGKVYVGRLGAPGDSLSVYGSSYLRGTIQAPGLPSGKKSKLVYFDPSDNQFYTSDTTITAASGTVTSIATGYGISGGTITSTGTLVADTSLLMTTTTNQFVPGYKFFGHSSGIAVNSGVTLSHSAGNNWAVYNNSGTFAIRNVLLGGDVVTLHPSTYNMYASYGLTTTSVVATGGVTTTNFTNTGTINSGSLAGTGSRAVLADANGLLSAPISDSSVKENIRPLEYGIKTIMKLIPVWGEYKKRWKNYGEGRQNFLIAQNVQKYIPEAVFITPQTGKLGINKDQLDAVYVQALQDLQHEINDLKAEIKKLKKRK